MLTGVFNRHESLIKPQPEKLCACFNTAFYQSHNTCLIGGAEEPMYVPAGDPCAGKALPYAQIYFTRDYLASALHEVAHWCIAGRARRSLLDYGYWYAPDGRTSTQQVHFEQVEVKPQALEWIFSVALGIAFRISVDNLQQGITASDSFKTAIYQQAITYLERGLPPRAALFAKALRQQFKGGDYHNKKNYSSVILS